MKKLFALSLVGLLVFVGCGKKEDNNTDNNNNNNDAQQQVAQPQVNTQEGIIEDKKLEEFTYTNTSMIYENGSTTLETTVTNTSSETSYLKEFHIHVYDESGKEITMLIGFIGDSLGAGESTVISAGTSMDLTKLAVTMEYEVIR